MGEAEDRDLVLRFQRGDEEAFDRLVFRHRKRVFSLVCRLAPSGEAEDLAQEVFLSAYRTLPRFRFESSFTTWLYRVTVHVCSHHHRKRRLDVEELDDSVPFLGQGGDPERETISRELRDRVRSAIDLLPYKLRLVIVLRDLHGLCYEEIAQVLGCPIGTVRSRLHYASHRLAHALQPYVEAVR